MRSQSTNLPNRRPARAVLVVTMLVSLSGCCGPDIGSQRFSHVSMGLGDANYVAFDGGNDCACGTCSGQGELRPGSPHPLLHAIAGPFLPHAIADPYQSTTLPPHSKFHPVPTRPVFAPVREFRPGPGFMFEGGPTLAPAELDSPEALYTAPEPAPLPPRLLPTQEPGELLPRPAAEPGSAERL